MKNCEGWLEFSLSQLIRSDEDWVKKCMAYRVEDRRPVGKTKKDMVRECRSEYGRT